jgi:hypothetical protein
MTSVTAVLPYLEGAACLIEIEGAPVTPVELDGSIIFRDAEGFYYCPSDQMITIGQDHPGVGYIAASYNGGIPRSYHIMFWTMVPLTNELL